MTSILWMLLNLSLFTFFIFLLFRATKAIRKRMGLAVTIFFVFCLSSFVCRSLTHIAEANPQKSFIGAQFTDKQESDTARKEIETIELDNRGTYKIIFGFSYGYSASQKSFVPLDAFTTLDGTVSFQSWKAQSISLKITDSTLQYRVNGSIEWMLLGTDIFSQWKTYSGSIVLK